MVSGKKPQGKALPNLSGHPDNIFTLLAGSYRMNPFEFATALCPSQLVQRTRTEGGLSRRLTSLFSDLAVVYLHLVTPRAHTSILPTINSTWGGFLDNESPECSNTDYVGGAAADDPFDMAELASRAHAQLWGDRDLRFEEFINTIGEDAGSTVHFFHWLMPHRPWVYLPTGRQYWTRRKIDGVAQTGDDWIGPQFLVDQFHLRHLLQLEYTDKRLGDLFDHLESVGVMDDALMVIVSDHGACFTTDDHWRQLSPTNGGEIAFVPLLIKEPGQHRGVIHDGFAQTVDILPTIAGILGAKVPWPMDGQSLLDGERKAPETIGITDFDGETWQLPYQDLLAARSRVQARNVNLFGLDRRDRSWYGVGSHLDLLGLPVSSLERTKESFTFNLEQATLLSDFNPEGSFAPVAVTGHISGLEHFSGHERAALSVNGVIAGLADLYIFGDAVRLSGIIVESAYTKGSNQVDLFVLRTQADGQPILSGASDKARAGHAAIILDAATGVLVDDHGRRLPIIQTGKLRGKIEDVIVQEGVVTMIGWAADFGTRRPLDRMAIFSGVRLLTESDGFIEREHVAQYLGVPKDTAFGCQLSLPTNQVGGMKRTPLFFAISEDRRAATLLHFSPDALTKLRQATANMEIEAGGLFRLQGQQLIRLDGPPAPLSPDAMAGSVDLGHLDSTSLTIMGWASDKRGEQPAATVLCFVDGVFAGSQVPNISRPDVAKHYDNPKMEQSGFTFTLAVDSIADLDHAKIRVLATNAEGEVSELRYRPDFPWGS
jgi:hypothetical protein